MRLRSWAEIGGNRGATRVGEALVASASGVSRVDVIDPKPGRAGRLRELYGKHGIAGRAFEGRGELLAQESDADGVIVAIDDLTAMRTLIEAETRPLAAQAVLEAPRSNGRPGTVYGFAVNVAPGRDDQRADGVALIGSLEAVSVPGSSSEMRRDAVGALALDSYRQRVSERTVEHMRDFKEVEDAEHIGELFAFKEQYPLVVRRSVEPELRRRYDEARDIGAGRQGKTALVLTHRDGVDLAILEHVRGRLVARDFVSVPRPIVRPRPAPVPSPVRDIWAFERAPEVLTRPLRFTD